MSSTPVVYKQRFNPRANPATPGLNVRHLQYIATRPGTVYNPGCGFGLWGHLPGDNGILVQTNLAQAKKIVREASVNHTLYRAVVSVGKKEAQEKGFYSRSRWEELVNAQIGVIAKQMDIKPQDMCWCASMHYAKNHPHVHILYWDNWDQPRPEFMPNAKFEIMTERIRAAFAGDIYRDEIRELQQDQREQTKEIRATLQAMCLEANPEKALNLPKLYNGNALDKLSPMFQDLILSVPPKGSLRYGYLPKEYKAKVDAFTKACLEVPELMKEIVRYEECTQKISELYANGDYGSARNLDNAWAKMYKELGNQVMDAIRTVKGELQETPPSDRAEVSAYLREASAQIVPTLPSYQKLRDMLPPERIPVGCMASQIPGYHEQMNKVVGDVLSDARIRFNLQGYAIKTAGVELDKKPYVPHRMRQGPSDMTDHQKLSTPFTPENSADGKSHYLNGKLLTNEEWEAYQEVYKEAKRDLWHCITEQVRQDAGWTDELVHTSTAMLLCGMLRLASQMASQQNAALSQSRLAVKYRSKDMSKEAKRNYWSTQKQAGSWEPDS